MELTLKIKDKKLKQKMKGMSEWFLCCNFFNFLKNITSHPSIHFLDQFVSLTQPERNRLLILFKYKEELIKYVFHKKIICHLNLQMRSREEEEEASLLSFLMLPACDSSDHWNSVYRI